MAVEKREGFVISQNNGPTNTQTGHLERRTLLHKRYLIQKTVGRGGMGAVYQAKDVKLQQIVAVKEMGLSSIPPEEQAQESYNFKIEAKMLANLHHPNLPTFSGFFPEGQRYFMVMEYIDGATLEELLERNHAPFSERRVLGWARQLCDVLEYLHNRQPPIIFRDMKPGNIMLTRDGHIKLIDFGIARLFRSTSSQDTQLLGTPGFAPPEQYGRAQTDERSDIYSLAITLFQLLTNTLSETGFGLKDVRGINPAITPMVAHALEKAAALDAKDRYSSIAEFRRALLGQGMFVFENGETATSVSELAELSVLYPEEAADYLADGEIEAWLREIGETEILRTIRHMRSLGDDPQATLQMFIQSVLGTGARLRAIRNARPSQVGIAPRNKNDGQSASPSRSSKNGTAATKPSRQTGSSQAAPSRGSQSWLTRKQASPILVSPNTVDFGTMYPEVSAPMIINIDGDQGLQVSGMIDSREGWIMLDREQFDGISTRVEIRIDATKLAPTGRHKGQVVITPYGEGPQQTNVVTIEAEVISPPVRTTTRRPSRNKPVVHSDFTDLDELDLEEDLFLNNRDVTLLPPPPTTRAVAKHPSSNTSLRGYSTSVTSQTGAHAALRGRGGVNSQDITHATTSRNDASSQVGSHVGTKRNIHAQAQVIPDRHTEYIAKYGQFTAQGKAARGWDPIQISVRHRAWIQRVLTGMAAFMSAGLSYNLVAHLIPTANAPLPPNPSFLLVQALIIPSATLGAMLVNWNRKWDRDETVDCTSTGLICTLAVVALVTGLWGLFLHNFQPVWMLIVLLFASAISAALGTNQTISSGIMYGISWGIAKFRLPMMVVTVGVGGILGYVLSAGFALGCLTLGSLGLGAGIAGALVWRVDQLMRQQQRQQQQDQDEEQDQVL